MIEQKFVLREYPPSTIQSTLQLCNQWRFTSILLHIMILNMEEGLEMFKRLSDFQIVQVFKDLVDIKEMLVSGHLRNQLIFVEQVQTILKKVEYKYLRPTALQKFNRYCKRQLFTFKNWREIIVILVNMISALANFISWVQNSAILYAFSVTLSTVFHGFLLIFWSINAFKTTRSIDRVQKLQKKYKLQVIDNKMKSNSILSKIETINRLQMHSNKSLSSQYSLQKHKNQLQIDDSQELFQILDELFPDFQRLKKEDEKIQAIKKYLKMQNKEKKDQIKQFLKAIQTRRITQFKFQYLAACNKAHFIIDTSQEEFSNLNLFTQVLQTKLSMPNEIKQLANYIGNLILIIGKLVTFLMDSKMVEAWLNLAFYLFYAIYGILYLIFFCSLKQEEKAEKEFIKHLTPLREIEQSAENSSNDLKRQEDIGE